MKLYSRLSDHETILELWGASTKHPDCVFYFSDFKLSEWTEPHVQIYQWLLECASKLNWPYHAYKLATDAAKMFKTYWNALQDGKVDQPCLTARVSVQKKYIDK